MKYKTKPSRRVFMIFAYGLMIVIAIICIAPLWHVLMASVSNPTLATNSKGLILWPLGNLDFKAYEIILGYARLWQGYGNTLLYIIGQCMVTGISTVIAGYVFSRNRFFYRNTFMMIISFTMLFNGGMIPTYMVIRNIGLIDTPLAMIIPQALSVFNILIMRTSMQNISDALEEAARIDGASDFKIMFKIVLPLSKATFAVIMLFTIVMKWNDYMSALLYLPTKTDLYPLQMVLISILITTSQDLTSASDLANSVSLYKKSVEYAVIVVSTLPILCVYPFVQKYFVTGITIGAVKS